MALINDFMSLIYPRHCEACGTNLLKHEEFICNLCLINLPKSNYHNNTVNELSYVFAGRIPLQHALCFYLFEKSGRVQKLLHAVKYQNQKELAEFLGKLYAKDLTQNEVLKNVDVVLPIPLHSKKLKLRGYNQSELFAKGIASELNLKIDTTSLKKTNATNTQTNKKKFERWENVEGVFELEHKDTLRNKHILIIDDVITTGATIEAAWQALKNVEGIKVSVLSLAFAAKN
ncbi:MAG: ComF family protein [Bacteroidota bacterium]|nr:ComF family protein [Bacteroidota bacterium]